MNVKLIIAYDGTNYLGWQKTKMGPSVEETLETVLKQVLQQNVKLQAASRTDAGVHAEGQVVNFFINENRDLLKLKKSISSMLPKSISLVDLEMVDDSFHPSLDVKEKEYLYWICNDRYPYPHHRTSSWHVPQKLDLSLMKKAAKIIVGTHNFVAFRNVAVTQPDSGTVRTIYELDIEEKSDKRICFTVRGDHFLYKMVRNIVGTLVDVGLGKINLDDVKDILISKDRKRAGVTAPAHGLILHHVFY